MPKTSRSAVPKPRRPATFSQKLPVGMTVNTAKMAVHIPLLNEDADPSAIPRKKKTTTIAEISASMPRKIQKNHNFKSISSVFIHQEMTFIDGN